MTGAGPDARTDARAQVLARVRSALGQPQAAAPAVPRTYRAAGDGGPVDLDLLADRLRDYRALVRTAATVAEVPGLLADAVTARAVSSLAVPGGLPAEWMTALGDALGDAPGDGVVVDDGSVTAADLDGIDGVVTGCAVAVAETGTIVLDGSPDQGRRLLSLVPDYHLCVVRSDDVVASVPDAVAALDPTRPLTWISGPSATSDIELERVEGVHGPRTLEVILVAG